MHYTSLICQEPQLLVYRQDTLHSRTPNTALLKIKQVGICGTDLHAFEGNQPFFQYPRILGHEICAELLELPDSGPQDQAGRSTQPQPGQLVSLIPYFNCGSCIACRRGKPNCCASIQVAGVHTDGALREFVEVPLTAIIPGNGLSADQLALVEPLAIGAHAVNRARIQPEDFVLVMGAGPIGLGLMDIARLSGAQVIALDINANRLEFCRKNLGINHLVNPKSENAVEAVLEITRGDMATSVFDATGNLAAIESGLQFLAHGGNYVLVGLQKQPFSFSHPGFHKRETTLMSSRNATRKDFDLVMNALGENKINPDNYITHRINFNELAAAFPDLSNPANKVVKAMVTC